MADTDIETDETADLIASNKVEGTAVYDRNGDRLGTIYNFMVDKVNGQVEYAVLSFGGLFGMGSDYYPLPWERLTYDEELGGYQMDLVKEDLEEAPRYSAEQEPAYNRAYNEQIDTFYDRDFDAA
jgi:sporulation protein YlmC with PRC-barrel domain